MSSYKIYPQQNKIAEAEETVKESSIKENLDQDLIHKVLCPLTISLRIFGLYFEKADRLRMTKQFSRLYSLFIVIIMWLNAIRIFTIFSEDDQWQVIFVKIGMVCWETTCAVIQASCYKTSQNGRILEVLQTFNKDMNSRWAKQLRVKVILCVIIAWIYVAFGVVSTAYIVFSKYSLFNVMIAPYTTMIMNSSPLTIITMDIVYHVMYFYISGANIFPIMWYCVLSSVISQEFKKCTKTVRNIAKDPATAKRSIEIVRCRHQMLCRMVNKVDGQVCLNTATYLVGLIFLIIMYLYTLIFSKDIRNNPYFLCVFLTWILASVFELIIVAHGGIMINQSVRIPEHS